MKIRIFIVASLTLITMYGHSQQRIPAYEMNERLGRGVNMGNSFEAPSETTWGNPWQPEYFKIMSDLGFDHVRLPVRWEPAERSMASEPYTINPEFLLRIQEVVDTALKYNLHIIVNMHHHEALYEDPEGQKARFLSQWDQIATHFQDYPDSVLFEVLNEPHGNLSPELWNQFFADALTEIRKTNPTRTVVLGVAEYGGLGGVPYLQVPNDENIILSIHYYNPFNFTHQGADWVGEQSEDWLGTTWDDTEADRETVVNEFNYAMQFAENNNIPIHIGEFGAYSEADIESRERWTTFLARWFEEQGMSWAYWEFSAGFGIYNPATESFITPLVDALLNNAMPEPTPIFATTIYESDFSTTADGWNLNTQGGAAGSRSVSDGKLVVSITNGGTETWHVQLVKNGIAFEKDKMYRISFKAQAAADRGATFYAGKASSPWNAYSGYNGISIGTSESNYVFSFTMSNPTDPSARLVFDFGTNATNVTISDIKVEELSLAITALPEDEIIQLPLIYPNPTSSVLFVEGLNRYQLVTCYDLNGRIVMEDAVEPHTSAVNLKDLPAGLYIVRLTGAGLDNRVKIIKE